MKQGFDDGMFREGSGTLADIDDEDAGIVYLEDDGDDNATRSPGTPTRTTTGAAPDALPAARPPGPDPRRSVSGSISRSA